MGFELHEAIFAEGRVQRPIGAQAEHGQRRNSAVLLVHTRADQLAVELPRGVQDLRVGQDRMRETEIELARLENG